MTQYTAEQTAQAIKDLKTYGDKIDYLEDYEGKVEGQDKELDEAYEKHRQASNIANAKYLD